MAETPTVPVAEIESKLLTAVPADFQPLVRSLVDQANKAEAEAIAGSPEARAKAVLKDPAVADAIKNIAAANVVGTVHELPAAYHEVKAGYKTTEFWLSATVIVLTQVGAFHLPGKYGDTITTSAAAAAYVVSRGLAKIGR